ncbi:MAG: iron ABC transporter permease [Clostridia bacterium]|nr:iron ABC transporter permease [Clostridia bacterium]
MRKTVPALIIAAFVAAIIIALLAGRYPISPIDIGKILLSELGIEGNWQPATQEMQSVLIRIRLPRILLALVVGASLSVAGAVFQALFRNPLASPDLLGATAGASFGAVLALLFFPPLSPWVSLSSFAFGVAAVLAAYYMAAKSRDRSTSVLILAGIVVSSVFQAGISILKYVADPYNELQAIVFWLMGSFQAAKWDTIFWPLIITIVCTTLITIVGWRLNIMSQDDEQALSLGIDIAKWRAFYIITSALMIAVCIAVCGTVGWVGLVVPHIARFLVGPEHRRLIIVTAFVGGTLMLLMDTTARSLFSSEIPISIMTSVIGAPFLGYLVLSQKRG